MRLGVIGYGRRMNNVVRECLRVEDPDVRVVGIVDPDEAGARGRLEECDAADARFYKDLDTLIREAKPDALAIGTRCNLHTPFAIEAARYDLPLYLEKPVSVSMEQALALERAFENSKCQVVVSFPLRVSPICKLTKSLLDDGAVGRPDHILGVNYVSYGTVYWEKGYGNFEVTQGLFLQKATHDFDYMTYLMDSPIVRVAAMATRGKIFGGDEPSGLTCAQCPKAEACKESPRNRRRNHSGGCQADHPCLFGTDVGSPETGMNEDSSSAVFEFASGAHGAYTQVFFTRRDASTRGCTVSGYDGTVKFDWYQNEIVRVRHHAPFTDTVKADSGMSHFGGDDALAENFIAVVQGKAQSVTPIQTGIQSAYICLAAKESSETGQFVNVRQVGQA